MDVLWRGLLIAFLLAIPAYAAWDYGGILPWSTWCVAVLALILFTLAVPLIVVRFSRLRHPELLAVPTLALLVWGYGAFQASTFSPAILRWFSPRAAGLQEQWIPAPLLAAARASNDPQLQYVANHCSISIAPHRTESWLLGPLLFAIFSLIAWSLFRTRNQVAALLLIFALCGTGFAVLGLIDLVRPPEVTTRFLEPDGAGSPFASFVNRNNAAGYLNLALGCAIGWTIYQLSTSARSRGLDRRFDFAADTPWQAVQIYLERGITLCNTPVILGLILSSLILFGIFASTSRGGGIAALSAGIVLVLQTLRTKNGFWGSAIATVIILATAGSLGFLGMTEIIQARFSAIFGEEGVQDGRLQHWQDGLAAAIHYLPWGSGFGTYRFAYLPFQNQSGDAWFENADNLWLEWFVEGGIGMLLLTAAIAVVVIQQLRRLDGLDSAHALGIKATGWFILCSMLVSQLFDFGLLLPSTYLVFAILLGTIAGVIEADDRGGLQRSQDSVTVTTNVLHRLLSWLRAANPTSRQVFIAVFGVALWACLYFSISHARSDAETDYWSRGINVAVVQRNREFLMAGLSRLNDAPAHSNFDAELCAVKARTLTELQHIAALDLETDVDREQLWRAGAVETRRAVYFESVRNVASRADNPLLPTQSRADLVEAYDCALTALCASPLDPRARELLLRLDFVGPAPEVSLELLERTGRLFPNSPNFLEYLARLAAINPGFEVAATMWKQALLREPGRLQRIWSTATQLTRSEDPLVEILPDSLELLVTALESLKLNDAQRAILIQRAKRLVQGVDSVSESPPALALQRARLEALLESWGQAEHYFGLAVQANPSDPEIRFRYAEVLERNGRTAAAIEQLTRCCLQSPENTKYLTLRRALQLKTK